MSNARSPRDVCSTTIGTSGLMSSLCFASSPRILPNEPRTNSSPHGRAASLATGTWPPERLLDGVLAALRRWTRASSAARRPELPGGLLALLRSPDLLARARLRHGYRLGRGGHQVDRLPG